MAMSVTVSDVELGDLPLRLKNSEEYFPENAMLLGISPMSSMIWAMWSSSLL